MTENKDVIIIGSGPAGLTAAIYIGRGGYDPFVIGGFEFGGQLMTSSEVENYPGFVEKLEGPDLMDRMRKQAEKFGAEILDEDATMVDFRAKPLRVAVGDREFTTRTVIIATGASPKWLDLESEQRLRGRGVSACATCDGFFFKDQKVMVVGGGDWAIEEALFLSRLAETVTLIHRRDQLRAEKIVQDRAFANERIRFLWDSVVEEVIGEDRVEGVRVRNVKTGETSVHDCQGVFIAIGHRPNTDLFRRQVDVDDAGYIKRYDETRTSAKGVFVAGDAYDFLYRQAVTAAASGCKAAIDAIKYLEGE